MSQEHHEIVIIKRHHGDHDDHHGGVWKIAFADFMTAMMAFFLVMWLIAANDKTRATVARYFNPVKLIDATVRPPGMHDPKQNDATTPTSRDTETRGRSKDVGHKEPEGPPPSEAPKGREMRLDATLRTNPFVALAEIAGGQGASDTPSKDAPHGSTPAIGRQGGVAFRDPFAPPPPQVADADDTNENPLGIVTPPPAPPQTAPKVAKNADVSKLQNSAELAKPAVPDVAKQQDLAQQKAQDLARQLVQSIKAQGHEMDSPDVQVKKTSEGFLISLTDTGNFSMFTSGSTVPSQRVVLMMEKVAKVLAARPGRVVIRGYTDNKPFRSGHYDNWNLSIDRAQTAHYMLVRGGLSDDRISSVEGFADHGSAAGVDPASPVNRRIEILLKDDAK